VKNADQDYQGHIYYPLSSGSEPMHCGVRDICVSVFKHLKILHEMTADWVRVRALFSANSSVTTNLNCFNPPKVKSNEIDRSIRCYSVRSLLHATTTWRLSRETTTAAARNTTFPTETINI
jgi:hypothetical protein